MTFTIKLDGAGNSFQVASNTPLLSVTGIVIATSARMDFPVMSEYILDSLFDVVRAFVMRLRICSMLDVRRTHHNITNSN